MDETAKKHSYTVPCSSQFRDAVIDLAKKRRANAGDLARSVVLVLPEEAVAAYPDPGEPAPGDRETVVLKSGSAAGRPWRRKPRLQVRLAEGFDIPTIRRALAIAIAVDAGEVTIKTDAKGQNEVARVEVANELAERQEAMLRETREELERLRAMVSVLSFDPLPEGIKCREDALHVLGFPPGRLPDERSLRARFRMLATIHHPDGTYGSHQRMSQLNAAMDVLRRGAA